MLISQLKISLRFHYQDNLVSLCLFLLHRLCTQDMHQSVHLASFPRISEQQHGMALCSAIPVRSSLRVVYMQPLVCV